MNHQKERTQTGGALQPAAQPTIKREIADTLGINEPIIYTFNPDDLCVLRSPGQKTILLDKFASWNMTSGTEYVIVPTDIKVLDTCIIIKKATCVAVQQLPEAMTITSATYLSTGCSVVIKKTKSYNGVEVGHNSSREYITIPYQVLDEMQQKAYDALSQTQKEEFAQYKKYISRLGENGLISLDFSKDFAAGRGFQLIKEETYPDPKQISSSYKEGIKIARVKTSQYKSIYREDTSTSPEDVTTTPKIIDYIPLQDSGLSYSIEDVCISPTGKLVRLSINNQLVTPQLSDHINGLRFYPGDGTGSYLEFANNIGWLTEPPIIMSKEDCEWIEQGGSLVYAQKSEEFCIGGRDGTNHIRDKIPTGYKILKDAPDTAQGRIKVNSPIGVRYMQDTFHNKEYSEKVSQTALRTQAITSLKAKGHIPYEYDTVYLRKFITPEKATEDDFPYESIWDRSSNTYSYGPYVGVSEGRGYRSTGYSYFLRLLLDNEVKHPIGGDRGGIELCIPQDGSGLYLRVPKEHSLRKQINFALEIKQIKELLRQDLINQGFQNSQLHDIIHEKFQNISETYLQQDYQVIGLRSKVINMANDLIKVHKTYMGDLKTLMEQFTQTVSTINTRYALQEIEAIESLLQDINGSVRHLEYKRVDGLLNACRSKIEALASSAECNYQALQKRASELEVPQTLLDAFGDKTERCLQFMRNVAKLPTDMLDSHEIMCGRNRSRNHLESVWNRIQGQGDFFCGADPNSVKYYIDEYHFGYDQCMVNNLPANPDNSTNEEGVDIQNDLQETKEYDLLATVEAFTQRVEQHKQAISNSAHKQTIRILQKQVSKINGDTIANLTNDDLLYYINTIHNIMQITF